MENSGVDLQLLMDQLLSAEAEAEANHLANRDDTENLTQQGIALLKLSQYGTLPESKKMLKDAISKLEEVVKIDSQKHEALWHLGKAHTSEALLASSEAQSKFEKANHYLQKALNEDPGNKMYQQSLEDNAQAMLFHMMQLQNDMVAQQPFGGSSTSVKPKSSAVKANANHDLMYDVFGWLILGAGILAWAMSQSHAHPPNPR